MKKIFCIKDEKSGQYSLVFRLNYKHFSNLQISSIYLTPKTYKRYSKHITVVSILGRDELPKSFMPFLCLKLKIGSEKWCNG